MIVLAIRTCTSSTSASRTCKGDAVTSRTHFVMVPAAQALQAVHSLCSAPKPKLECYKGCCACGTAMLLHRHSHACDFPPAYLKHCCASPCQQWSLLCNWTTIWETPILWTPYARYAFIELLQALMHCLAHTIQGQGTGQICSPLQL